MTYNSKLDLGGCSRSTPSQHLSHWTHESFPSYAPLSHSFVQKCQVVSIGGKVPLHGPKRFVNHGPLFRSDYETFKSKFYEVSKSEVENYKILCKLASSEFQRLVLFHWLYFAYFDVFYSFFFNLFCIVQSRCNVFVWCSLYFLVSWLIFETWRFCQYFCCILFLL